MSESTKDLIACVALIIVSAALGGGFTSLYYDEKIAEMNKAQAEAVAQAERKNAEGLAKATDTINLASAEYNDLRGELDRARARLRHANSRSSAGGDSADALDRRVAELEKLVQRLAESGSECGRLYQRCASNHDALADTVKP